MKKLIFLIIIAISVIILPSCGGSSRTTKVNVAEDGDVDTRNELSGEWNDADLRSTAKTLVNQMLTGAWIKRHKGKLPYIKIGIIKNKTDSHELGNMMDSFRDEIQMTITNSGLALFTGGVGTESNFIRKDKDDQMTNSSDDTVKEAGAETGADYMVFGQFSDMEDRLGGKKIKYLQVNLKLIDIEKNVIVWVGQKKIKKFIQQKSRTW